NSIERGSHDYWTLSPKRIDAIDTLAAHAAPPTGTHRRAVVDTLPSRFYDSVLKNPALRDARGYVIPSDQPDFPTAVRFINALIGDGVSVDKATAAFIVKGKTYPSGSFIVKTNQAFRPHILDMFEPQDHPNDFAYPGGPPIAPYDAAGWTLAYTMGIKFDRILEGFDGPFQRIPYGEELAAPAPVVRDGWLDARCNSSFTEVNRLLKTGKTVYRSTANGNFYIGGHRPASTVRISPARIAVWDTYGGSIPSGWLRFIMERYDFPFDVVYAPAIDSGRLRDKY